jgi:hypothetical protein
MTQSATRYLKVWAVLGAALACMAASAVVAGGESVPTPPQRSACTAQECSFLRGSLCNLHGGVQSFSCPTVPGGSNWEILCNDGLFQSGPC